MRKAGRWSTRTLFVAAVALMLLPVTAVALFLLDQSYQRAQDQLTQIQLSIADVVAQGVSTELQSQEEGLTTLAATELIRALDDPTGDARAALNAYVAARPGLTTVAVLRADTSVQDQTGGVDPNALGGEFAAARDAALSGGEPTVSDVFTPDGSDVQLIAVIVPIYPNEEQAAATEDDPPAINDPPAPARAAAGALVGFLSVERLVQSIQPPNGFGTSEEAIALVSPSNNSISIPESTAEGKTLFPAGFFSGGLIQSALGGQRSEALYDDSGGNERLAAAVPLGISGADWAVVVSSPSVVAFAPNRVLIERGLIGLGVAVLLSLILAAVFGELIGRPIRELTSQAQSVARGDLRTPIAASGRGEAAGLGIAIRDMADQLITQVRDTDTARTEILRQADRLRDLLRRTVRLQEDERRRIAGDIHDAVSPLITGALYQARALKLTGGNGNGHAAGHGNGSTIGNGPHGDADGADGEATVVDPAEEGLAAVSELLERAMAELHDVIFDLRPPDLDDLGVVAAIERYVGQIHRTGLPCRLEVLGEQQRLAPEARLAVYRIVQESLHNALRHARADEAYVRLEWLTDRLRVTIRDNGSGFEPDGAGQRVGLGLLSMRERAAAIGATIEIASRPGSGTAIILERPLDAFDLIDEPAPPELAPDGTDPMTATDAPSPNGRHADDAPVEQTARTTSERTASDEDETRS